jgi:acyl-CoA reductase-like NAD-dependent aldehyde dehydrogenase
VVFLASTVASSVDSGIRALGAFSSEHNTSTASSISEYDIDTLFRSARAEANASANSSTEARRILAHALAVGQMSAADRDYLAELIASRTGLSQQESERRVDAVLLQVRQAADEARKASASASIYLALSMLLGALIAGAAAAIGGQVRDLHP